jgi:hypothetical protein
MLSRLARRVRRRRDRVALGLATELLSLGASIAGAFPGRASRWKTSILTLVGQIVLSTLLGRIGLVFSTPLLVVLLSTIEPLGAHSRKSRGRAHECCR